MDIVDILVLTMQSPADQGLMAHVVGTVVCLQLPVGNVRVCV